MGKELDFYVITYDELDKRFDKKLFFYQETYNDSKDKLSTITQLIAIRDENERIISALKNRIINTSNYLKQFRFLHFFYGLFFHPLTQNKGLTFLIQKFFRPLLHNWYRVSHFL